MSHPKFYTTLEQHERGKQHHHKREFLRHFAVANPDFLQQYMEQNGPYLYHGTSPEAAQKIAVEGLYPHDHEQGAGSKWTDQYLEPRSGHVYMGNYKQAGAYARSNVDPLLRIDMRKLDPQLFNADEDHFALGAAMENPNNGMIKAIHWNDPPPIGGEGDSETLGAWADRLRLGENPDETHHSLQQGTMAYNGVVPPEAIELDPVNRYQGQPPSAETGWKATYPDWSSQANQGVVGSRIMARAKTVGDGDGHVMCKQGHYHWGLHGAAGMLLRHTDPTGVERYLLTLRSANVMQGGCWGVPGGAIDSHETPLQGALREAHEELGGLGQVRNTHVAHSNDHDGWAYHTVVADTDYFLPSIRPEAQWENDDVRWFTAKEIDKMTDDLHPGFAETWAMLKVANDADNRVIQSNDEIHVGMDIPTHAAKAIYRWARELPLPEGAELEHPKEYHCTLMYTPQGHAEHKDAWWIKHMDHAHVKVNGVDSFKAGDKGYAYVLKLDAPDVQAHGQALQDRAEDQGFPITHFPGGYQPHITFAYGPTKIKGVEPPDIELDIGPSRVSDPRRDKLGHAAPEPPNLRRGNSTKHCGNCTMFDRGLCWGYGDYAVDKDELCDSWEYEDAPREASLTSIANYLHHHIPPKTSATELVERIENAMARVGYTPNEINKQAVLTAWGQMYPDDLRTSMAADPHWLDDWMERNGPYLYHSTKKEHAPGIDAQGLLPWDHPDNAGGSVYQSEEYNPAMVPRPNHVYMRHIPDAATYFANRHLSRPDTHDLYQVDLRQLDPERLNTDEDSMVSPAAQRIWPDTGNMADPRWREKSEQTMSSPSQTAWSLERPNLEDNALRGTVAYNGVIPATAIRRVDPNDYVNSPGQGQQISASTIMYHWTEAADTWRWTDPSHTGPGHTHLTKSGSLGGVEDVPDLQHPVRIAIDTSQLNPELFAPAQESYPGNALYNGVIPPGAVIAIQPEKPTYQWDHMNVVPSLDTDWQSMGEDERHHNDVQFSNDTKNLA